MELCYRAHDCHQQPRWKNFQLAGRSDSLSEKKKQNKILNLKKKKQKKTKKKQ